MKKVRFAIILAAVGIVLSACTIGLDPAWKGGAELRVDFGASGSGHPSRALAVSSGSAGYLSIQMRNSSGAKAWGPWPVAPGQSFSTTQIPPGRYSSCVLVYSALPVSSSWLRSQELKDLAPALSSEYRGSASWASAGGVNLEAGQTVSVAATLVPAVPSSLIIDPSSSSLFATLEAFPSSVSSFRFVQLKNLGSGLGSAALSAIRLDASFENESAENGTFAPAALKLYDSAGRFVADLPRNGETDFFYSWTSSDAGWDSTASETFYLGCAWDSGIAGWFRLDIIQNPADPVDPVDPVASAVITLTGPSSNSGKKVIVDVSSTVAMEEDLTGGVGFGAIGADGSLVLSIYQKNETGEYWIPADSETYTVTLLIDSSNLWPANLTLETLGSWTEEYLAGSSIWIGPDVSSVAGILEISVNAANASFVSSFLCYPEAAASAYYYHLSIPIQGETLLMYPIDPVTESAYMKEGFLFAGWASTSAYAAAGIAAYPADATYKSVYTGAPGVDIRLWAVWAAMPVEPVSVVFSVYEVNPAVLTVTGPSEISVSAATTLAGPSGYASWLWTLNGTVIGTAQTCVLSLATYEGLLNTGVNEIILTAVNSSNEASAGVLSFTLLP